MSSQEEIPIYLGEIMSEPINARFDSDSVWADASLVAEPDELARRVAMASVDGRDLAQLISAVDARDVDEDELGGVLALTRWLLARWVSGSRVRTPLYYLVLKECRDLVGQPVEETERGMARLAERLHELPVSDNDEGGRTAVLGDLLPSNYVMRSAGAEQTLKLASPPPYKFDRMSPRQELFLAAPAPSAAGPTPLKGCTQCRPDPNSRLGGSRYCFRPGFQGLVECQWPPPEPDPVPEPTWEYFVQVGNKWWTTFVGIWHATAYTRTIKTTASGALTVPWIVPTLQVKVATGAHYPFPGNLAPCESGFSHPIEDEDEDVNDNDVYVGASEPSIFGTAWGVYSEHYAAGLNAAYCEGWWDWWESEGPPR